MALYRIKNANSSTRKELDVGVDETCQLHVVKTVIGVGIDKKYTCLLAYLYHSAIAVLGGLILI